MIEKTIHYCWFGKKEKPKLAKKCIESWKKFCPGYEIVEWNENNFPIDFNEYTKKCYQDEKYAFLTDYARLYIIYTYGGIYFDTDVEVVRNIDDLLTREAFFGFETPEYVNTGEGFGACKGNALVAQMLKEYDPFLDGMHGVERCPKLNTEALLKFGLKQDGTFQIISGACIYPTEYFNPYDDPTGILTKTSNTYSIHWYGKSWMSKTTIVRSWLTKPLHRLQRIL